jgi:hypothetical protein
MYITRFASEIAVADGGLSAAEAPADTASRRELQPAQVGG